MRKHDIHKKDISHVDNFPSTLVSFISLFVKNHIFRLDKVQRYELSEINNKLISILDYSSSYFHELLLISFGRLKVCFIHFSYCAIFMEWMTLLFMCLLLEETAPRLCRYHLSSNILRLIEWLKTYFHPTDSEGSLTLIMLSTINLYTSNVLNYSLRSIFCH